MKRLACLVPWMAVTVAWGANLQPAAVQLTYYPAVTDAYRFGDQCFVTPATAKKNWDWNVEERGDEFQVTCEGRLFRVGKLKEKGANYLNLTEAARFLGAQAAWTGDTYSILAKIRSVEVSKTGLAVNATLRVRPKFTRITNPDRYIIDLKGAVADSPVTDFPDWWRIGQYSPDTARLVVEHPGAVAILTPQTKETRLLEIALPEVLWLEPDQVKAVVPAQNSVAPTANTIWLQQPAVTRSDKTGVGILVPASKSLNVGPAARYNGPNEIQISLPGAQFDAARKIDTGDSEHIESLTSHTDGDTGVVTIRTKRPMAFVTSPRGKSFTITLTVPSAGEGLRGKIVVIDAGHGGKDNGTSYGSYKEKEIALGVAKALKSALFSAGASVVMTRDDDSYPSLGERPALANQSGAAVFVSIHVNSVPKADSRSGSITFFHLEDPLDRLLAECIQNELARASAIPSLGIWSDGRIYTNGFKVLRDSTVPSVLIEMGFLNHRFDRAELAKAGYNERAAAAILKGIKIFLGEKN